MRCVWRRPLELGGGTEFFKEARILFEVIFYVFLLCIEQIDFFFICMIRMPNSDAAGRSRALIGLLISGG